MLHHRRRGNQKSNYNSGAAILLVSTYEPAYSIQASRGATYATTSVQFLWKNWQNKPQGKRSQDDGALLPRRTPCLSH